MKSYRIAILGLLLMFTLTACGNVAESWQDQYDAGIRYLSEENYKEAIAAFTSAIKIDGTRSEGFEGRADAYVCAAVDTGSIDSLLSARQDYSQAYERDHSDLVALKMQAVYEQVIDFYYDKGEIETAKGYFDEMLPLLDGSAVPDRWSFEEQPEVNTESAADHEENTADTAELSENAIEPAAEQTTGQTEEIIDMGYVPFSAEEFLQSLDGNSWHFTDSASGSHYVFGFTFDGNGTGSYYYGYMFSEILGEGTMSYSMEGNQLTLTLSEGISAVYQLDYVGDFLLMVQTSSKGLFYYHERGYELTLIPGLYADWSEMP